MSHMASNLKNQDSDPVSLMPLPPPVPASPLQESKTTPGPQLLIGSEMNATKLY